MSKIASFSEWLLRSPIIWGGLAWVMVWTVLTLPIFDDTLVERYVLGHPIEIATAWLFCMAMAALCIR